MKTPLEVASNGLRMNKTRKLAIMFLGGEKGRGVKAEEDIEAGEQISNNQSLKTFPPCFPPSERNICKSAMM